METDSSSEELQKGCVSPDVIIIIVLFKHVLTFEQKELKFQTTKPVIHG